MTELLFGTTNPTRKSYVQEILKGLPIRVLGLDDLGIRADVEEDGATPEANARKKAGEYCRLSGLPTLAIDTGLHLDGFPPEKQPGQFVRRIYGDRREATDDELLAYYIQELTAVGGESHGTWLLGIGLVFPSGHVESRSFERRTHFVATPSPVRLPRSPLASLQVDEATGRYEAELSHEERSRVQAAMADNIRRFVAEHMLGDDATHAPGLESR